MLLCSLALTLAQNGPTIEWSTTEIDYAGARVAVRRGTLEVPERYEGLSRILKLPVSVLPPRDASRGAPIVFLHGGPGGSGLAFAQSSTGQQFFSAMRDAGDVVIFDQRGGGQSQPPLVAPLPGPIPTDFLLSEQRFRDALMAAARHAAEHVKDKADVTAYTTVENANDLDALRRALGVEKIKILAHSYGTHLAQAYLKQYPDRVESAVLMGTEGLAMTMKLPSTYKRQFEQLTELIKAHRNTKNDVPNFTRLVQMAAERMDKEPLVAEHGGKQYQIGGFGLLWLLRWDIGDTADLPQFPRIAHAAFDGNVAPLMPMFRKRLAQLSSGFPVVSFVMDEASGCDPERLAQIKRESEGFFFAPVVNMAIDGLAEPFATRTLGPDFRRPVQTGVPTLFVSGTLDSNTPPFQATEVRKGFSRSWHLVLRNGGHEDYLWNADAIKAVAEFLKSGRAESRTINLPVPEFLSILK